MGLNRVPGDARTIVRVTAADSPFQATVNQDVFLVDTSGGPVTIRLPPALANTDVYQVVDNGGHADTNPITIDGNGHLINGSPTLVLAVAHAGVSLFAHNGAFAALAQAGGETPSSTATQQVFVSKGGSDVTGTGTITSPFHTISHAMASIADGSRAKRYQIDVGPGEYSETWGIKPWVGVCGASGDSNGVDPDGSMLTEITAPTNTVGFDPSFNAGAGFGVGWFENLGFTNGQTWDQSVAPGMQPQLNFRACAFNAQPTFVGTGTVGFDNVTMDDCLSYGGVSVRGWQFLWTNSCRFLGGTCAIQAGAAGATEDTTWLAQNCSVGSATSGTNVTLTGTVGGRMATADWSNTSQVGSTTLTNPTTSFKSQTGGPWNVTLNNGAPAPVINLPYAAASVANWNNAPPTSVSNALDRIAARVGPIS
jgi:hypothetical protein